MSVLENTFVELKAKVDNLEPIRRKLKTSKAKHVGNFRQTDIYFAVPKGRLKLRQIDNEKAKLIYYERKNISGPRRGNVFLMEIPEDKVFTALLKKILKVRTSVRKIREIYQFQRMQINLDTVDSLGCYVEFQRRTSDNLEEIERSAQLMEKMIEKLQIKPENLEKLSYSDLVNLK